MFNDKVTALCRIVNRIRCDVCNDRLAAALFLLLWNLLEIETSVKLEIGKNYSHSDKFICVCPVITEIYQ